MSDKSHASTLLDFARVIGPALNRIVSPEASKAQRAAKVLERALEELVGGLK